MDQVINIFLSYAHEDALLHDELVKHLSVLKNEGFANTWSDHEIKAGSEWQKDISDHLATADLILLLISADFLASANCYESEMKQALERHAAGQARVVPILLRAVDWESAPFDTLQVLPFDITPVVSQPSKDEAFQKIAKSIRSLVEEMLVERGQEHLAMGKYTQAVQVYRNVLKLRPTNIPAYQGLAKALFSLKQYEEALGEYEKAIRFDKRNPVFHQERGNMLLELKRYEEALGAYSEAIEIAPQEASGYVDKGYALLHMSQYKDALTAYEDALRLNSHAASAYGEKGKALDELKKFKGDIAAIVEQLLPSLQLSQQEYTSNSPTSAVKIAPSAGTLLLVYTDHRTEVKSVAWLPSSERYISSVGNDDLRIWRASTGRTLWYHKNMLYSLGVAWSHNQQRFAFLAGFIEIWESDRPLFFEGSRLAREGTYLILNEGPTPVLQPYTFLRGEASLDLVYTDLSEGASSFDGTRYKRSSSFRELNLRSASWSPEGLRIASTVVNGSVYNVYIWEVATGKVLEKYAGATSAAWSPKENSIASLLEIAPSQSDRPFKDRQRGPNAPARYKVIVWEVGTHRVIRTFEDPSGSISFLEWSPDGNYLAAMSNKKNVFIWEVRTGHTILTYSEHAQDQGRNNLVKWSPDGKYLASVNGKSIHVWEAATGRTSLVYKGHSENVTCIAWSPSGTRIASGSMDQTVQVWLAVERDPLEVEKSDAPF